MIKFADILFEILHEAKQVGKIYHFTGYKKMIDIINDRFHLISGWMKYGTHDKVEYISFTRNKSLKSEGVDSFVRIMIDGDKMSNKYKFEPYTDLKGGFGRLAGKDEAEERIGIEVKKYPDGIDISNYILNIDILKPDKEGHYSIYNELRTTLNKKQIKYNIVDKF